MAQSNNNDQTFQNAGNSNIILGTSSDAIIDGLHSGNFSQVAAISEMNTNDDKDQIVNQQDQHEIVNAEEKDYESKDISFTDTNPKQVVSPDPLYSDKTDEEISGDKTVPENESNPLPGV